MKRKFTLLIAALALLTMIVQPGRAWGQTKGSVTFTFSDHYSSNTVLDATAISLDASIQATFNKRNGGTATQYYTNGNAVRWYGGGTLLIEAKTGSNATITNITINYTQTANSVSASVGTYSLSNNVGTWTGSASAVTFTQSGTSGHCRISAISVTYSTGGSTAVATPTITPNSGSFLTSQEVSIACATADATIYYTTDGSNPTTSSTQYTEAFTVTETTTVKAFAVKSGLDNSQVATATYTKATVMTVAEARDAIDDGTGTQGVYVTGIVSQIVTPWGQNNYQNITFNIVDQSGDEEFLQAFRCVGDEAPNVAVNDSVVVYGNLTKYQTTYEFAQGCQVVSLTHPTITVATPTFNPEGGIYNAAQTVTITTATEGADIYYTLDGTDPTLNSTLYENPIVVSTTTTIKAIAVDGDDNMSAVSSATYTIISVDNISSITEVGTAYMVQGTVVATNSKGFVMGDGTGYVYYYKGNDAGKSVGDMVTVSGTTGTYGQIIQFTNTATVAEATTSNYDNTPAAETITAVPDYTQGYHLSTYFEFEGTLAKSGSNYLITLGESQIQISYPTTEQGIALTALDGKTVHVKGYFTGINSNSKFTVMLESAVEVVTPSIDAENVNIAYNDTAGEIAYTINNPVEGGHFDAVPLTGGDRFTIGTITDNTIPFTCPANTGATEQTATIELRYTYNSTTVKKVVTITQAAAPQESIAVEPASVSVDAEEHDGTLTITVSNMTIEADDLDIEFYDANEQVITDIPTWIVFDDIEGSGEDFSLYYTIGENDGEARAVYIKVFGLGANDVVYSNLVTINQAAPVTPPTPGTWVLTPLADLAEGDVFVIVGTRTDETYGGNYAMSNNNGTLSAPSTVAVNVSGQTLTGEIADTIQWNISGNATDGYTFYPNGTTETWLYCTNTNNGVRVGTNTNSIFTIDQGYLYHNATSRYVGIYNSQDWRCYTLQSGNIHTNIADQTFAFYKKVTGPVPTEPSITLDSYSIESTAAGLEGNLEVTYVNYESPDDIEASVWFCDANGETAVEYDWILAAIDDKDVTNLYYIIGANTGDARTAYFKVLEQSEGISSDIVTVSQDAYVAPVPSITIAPAAVTDVPAAGATPMHTVTLANMTITSTDEFEFAYCDSEGNILGNEDPKPNWIELAEALYEQDTVNVYTMLYAIAANEESTPRTGYFKIGVEQTTGMVYSDPVTVTQVGAVIDYATLPFEWVGSSTNGSSSLTSMNGVTASGLGSDYAASNAPYRIKLDGTGDYIQIKTNEQPGLVTLEVKMLGGAETSYITVQGSTDGETFDQGEALEISGAQNTELTLTSTRTFDEEVRYVRMVFTKGSNVGVGSIAIAQVDLTPSITINPGPYDINANGGDAILPVTYKNMPADPQAEVLFYESNNSTTPLNENPSWITATINNDGNVNGHIDANYGEARSAYFKVKGIDADNNPVYSGLVTVNQAAYVLSIEFETDSLKIVAGGEQNRLLSFDYQGLGENPTFEVRTYDATGQTPTTYEWLTTAITQDNKVNITVAANTGDARSAYFKVYGYNSTVNTESNLVTISQSAAGVTYTLVETDNDIVPGQHYIIVGTGTNSKYYAMGSQANNYRNQVEVTVNGKTIEQTEGVYEVVLSGDGTNKWTIYDENTPGYLYAAGVNSGENYVKTQETNNDRGIWTISIDTVSYAAEIKSITTETERNILRYNFNSTRFSCYNGGQRDIYLYKKNNDTDIHYYSPSIVEVTTLNTGTTPTTVLPNEILTVTSLTSNNPDNLIIQDGGQLVFDGTGVYATMKKSTAHAGAKDGVATDWYTIASPLKANVATDAVGNLTNGTYDLYRYNEQTAMWENAKDTQNSGGFDELAVGRGYLYWNESGSEITFAGELRNEAVAYTLTANGTGDLKGFNLIGNPFSQNITMSNITGASLSGGYVLTQAGGWDASIDEIAPCQGFLVQVTEETPITITKSTNSSKSRANRDYLAFTVANSEYEDVTYAMFEKATGLNKINHRNSNIPMVYIPQDGQNYAIATMGDDTKAFNLNFKAMTTGQYTLSFKAEGKYNYLHVIDRLTGEDVDMLLDGKYEFIGSPRDNEARFIVKLDYNANIDATSDIFAYQNGDDIIVSGEGTLQIFDVMGRFVSSIDINGTESISAEQFNTGVYVFRMVGETVKTQKIVVR